MKTHGMRRDVFRILHPSADVTVLGAMIENLDTDEDVDAAKKLAVGVILESAEAVLMSLRLSPYKYSTRWASTMRLKMISQVKMAAKNDSSHGIIKATTLNK